MAIFHFDNLAKNLPDCYKKDTASNNFKILEVERQANEESRLTLDSIDYILDIENATGTVLDMYGERFGQSRESASDAQYRIMIKSKIMRSLCDGSYKSIVDALCYTFNCSIDEILLQEDDLKLHASKIPMNAILGAGFSATEAEQIIKKLLPAGITLESVFFEGTFEFGEEEYETGIVENDEGIVIGYTGFVDGDGNGGYLGYLTSSEKQGTLPI